MSRRLMIGSGLAFFLLVITRASRAAAGLLTGAQNTKSSVKTVDQVVKYMASARSSGRVGTARKTRPVDARPARVGEVVVSVIKGEGKETHSRPAVEGDWVVRNRCPETGNEEYLVSAATFKERYRQVDWTRQDGEWREFQPHGKLLGFTVIPPVDGAFTFKAPWGEDMVAKPGDALVQDPDKPDDIYRVAKASFECTYEVVTPPTVATP